MKYIVAIVVIVMLMTGCAVEAGEHAETTELTATPMDIVEVIETVETEFKFGDVVWSVRRCVGGEEAYLVKYSVVAQDGELVFVVPAFTNSVDELRQNLTDAAEMPVDEFRYLDVVLVDNCYLNREDAQAVADAENGE